MSRTKLNLVRARQARGEPPSFARRGPSRAAERSEGVAGRVAGAAGLETLPGSAAAKGPNEDCLVKVVGVPMVVNNAG